MDSTLACLAAWMPRQRWYAAKARLPSLRLAAWWDLPAEDCTVRTFLVADEGALPVVLYQVPVVARATSSVDANPDHIIGSPEPGTTFIDGPFDPAYSTALLALISNGGRAGGPGTVVTGHPSHQLDLSSTRSATVLAGEQSNTSLIYRADDGSTPIIAKVFRQLHPGLNPDIELTTALAAAGSPHVPPAVGSVEGEWPDGATSHGTTRGSLAFAQEFLPGVEDAWRVALRAAASGEDFADRAHALGEATANVHVSLAQLFPTHDPQTADREATAATWRRRLAIAMAEVPAIAERKHAIEEVYERAWDASWPPLQRIHGDYHLGQVLHDPVRGWVLLDFEGEPLRPMAERTQPDLALRDVAGMLRSFDYVAGSIRLDHPDRSPEAVAEWVRAARQGFEEGYAGVSGVDLAEQRDLLSALELDKAVYEAIYESRNRPTWVTIPLRAIARLVERSAVG
ncbi:aminoglycoside phosphotransferase [Microbacterium sp. 4R-513]|uniref:maltokinase N-terminal cap-like domain-containing protein n=1 Tax=Microbacterium sp. 4R-513 TaxID=2567934 RepID=UPI0013E20836|nr:phosphotransferase [Microbacterium sp. 4R-513]QIG40329.1 aminoglycoside phosphotransferase [Microbacterium sp. 4R-513]